jgi:DNA gyrase subunit B
LLTLFYRYFKPVIEAGYLYIAQPPLYKIKKGKEVSYAFSDEEKIVMIGGNANDIQEIESAEEIEIREGNTEEENDELDAKSKKAPKISIQRYKGLGEMNPEELWETTMKHDTRTLKQVSIEDAVMADQTFDTLMGSEVAPRKSFIQSNAKMAELDI